MSEAVQLALIDKIPALVAAFASVTAAWLAYRTHKVAKQTEQNTNHLTEELVRVTGKEQYAAGVKSETDKNGGTVDRKG